jgi:hypothetical protein
VTTMSVSITLQLAWGQVPVPAHTHFGRFYTVDLTSCTYVFPCLPRPPRARHLSGVRLRMLHIDKLSLAHFAAILPTL